MMVMLVDPATWEANVEDHLSPGVLSYSALCQLGVHTKSRVNMVTTSSRGSPGCLRRGDLPRSEMEQVIIPMVTSHKAEENLTDRREGSAAMNVKIGVLCPQLEVLTVNKILKEQRVSFS